MGLSREQPLGANVPPTQMAKSAAVDFAGVRLTSPEKVLYPEQGVTKRALAEYYEAVAAPLLPHVARRPLSLVRCPAGSAEACFFQKHVGSGVPKEIHRIEVPDGAGTAGHPVGASTYLWVDDLRGLVALCQMGVLEIHPWGSRIDALERPDVIVFDLDPDADLPYARVKEAAKEMRERLAALKLQSFVKTTGGKGLHVVVPTAPRHDWTAVKPWARAFVEAMVADAPGRYTVNMLKKQRVGRIFLDYLRNGRGATAVAPYSTRARATATVALPIAWEALTPRLDPQKFTVETVPGLLAKTLDSWADFARLKQDLGPALKALQ